MRQRIAIVCLGVVLALPLANAAFAQNGTGWTEPFPPFRIAGNLYYVGSKGLANYLVTTPQGNILINSDLEANVPMIEASIEKLGRMRYCHSLGLKIPPFSMTLCMTAAGRA